MELKRKTLRRTEWTRITRRKYQMHRVNTALFSGAASLITIEELTQPLWVPDSPFGPVLIADRGYRWLQIAPEGKHWWLTVMFDENGGLVQSYFDITRRNDLTESENAYFIDMFLDVAIPAEGEPAVLDRDELDAALADGSITEEEHALALRTAEKLLRWYAENREAYLRFLDVQLRTFQAEAENGTSGTGGN